MINNFYFFFRTQALLMKLINELRLLSIGY